jgi:hypothetical protein
VAILHAWGANTLPGQTNASSSRDSIQLFVCTKHAGYWQFDAMQNSRRMTMEQQRFADDYATLSPGDQGEVRHRVATMRH